VISLRPISQKEAFAFVELHHRHHDVPRGDLWRHAAQNGEGQLIGVAIVGRPVARRLDDGYTVEVTRLCTLGHLDCCSILYAAAARQALDTQGHRRILTYVLGSESGDSLLAAGWSRLWKTRGGSWDREGRPREDRHPTEPKWAWGKGSWRELCDQQAA
jgi:hypothetical protein